MISSNNVVSIQSTWQNIARTIRVVSGLNFMLFSSGKLQSSSVKEDVCKKTGVTDQQLDQEIPESDIILLSEKCPHLLLSMHKLL